MDADRLRDDLVRDEVLRLKPYDDATSKELASGSRLIGKLTGGVGRNLTDKGFSQSEVMFMLDNDIAEHLALLDKYLPWWRTLDDIRQLALANLAFNLGVGPSAEQPLGKLLTFHDTLKALQNGEYDVVANHLSVTLWAKQVGARADRIIAAMRNGEQSETRTA